jgi:hypothetical protein
VVAGRPGGIRQSVKKLAENKIETVGRRDLIRDRVRVPQAK